VEGVGPGVAGEQYRVCGDCHEYDPQKVQEVVVDIAGGPKDGFGNTAFSQSDDGTMIRLEKVVGLGDEGIHKLAAALKHCKRDLVKIFLDSNAITDVGAEALGASIANCAKLQKVQIRRNQLTEEGKAKLLAAAHATLKAGDLKC
jgi:hypothetical protein